jgi:hypothetical protein
VSRGGGSCGLGLLGVFDPAHPFLAVAAVERVVKVARLLVAIESLSKVFGRVTSRVPLSASMCTSTSSPAAIPAAARFSALRGDEEAAAHRGNGRAVGV